MGNGYPQLVRTNNNPQVQYCLSIHMTISLTMALRTLNPVIAPRNTVIITYGCGLAVEKWPSLY